jgi:predicted MPP superfamily phosphohydrolase
MLSTPLALLVILLGHGMLLVLAVNASHGLGFHSRKAEHWTLLALAVAGFASLAFAAWVLAGHPWQVWPRPARAYGAICVLVALVGFPAVTVARALRRPPEGLSGSETPLDWPDRAASRSRSPLHRWPGNQSLDPVLRSWRVPILGLPEALDGLSIVHLTDLHMSPRYDPSFFEAAADEANRPPADLVLLTGDIVEDESAIDWIAPVLGRIDARLGKLAILGNHDLLYGPEAIRRAVRDAGFEDVDGRWTALETDAARLAIGGTSAPWGPALHPHGRPQADLSIVLSHTPDRFHRIASWDRVDLVLAGHNHGGQVRLPALGPVLMPSLYSRRFDQGFFRRGRTAMYVSRGLGAKHPIRYNCRPEIARIVLVKAPELHPRRSRRSRAALANARS